MALEHKGVVLVPTYNECKNVAELVKRIACACPNLDILIIDDNSPDKTAGFVRQIMNDYPRLHLLEREVKEGLGLAYISGFQWALDRDYDFILQMDGDLSHQPEDIPRFIEMIGEHDVVLGSRYISGGNIENWEFYRKWLSKGGNAYARWLLGLDCADITTGFRAFRRKAIENVLSRPLLSKGYAFQIEVLARAYRSGYSVKEIPINFVERSHGKTKINTFVILEAFVLLPRIRFQKHR